MRPFKCGSNWYRIRRVPNPARRGQFGYRIDWRTYWPLTGWRWSQRDDIGFVSTLKEARQLIWSYELDEGVKLAHDNHVEGVTI